MEINSINNVNDFDLIIEVDDYAALIRNYVKHNRSLKILDDNINENSESDEELMAPNIAEEHCGIDTSTYNSNPLNLKKPHVICDVLYNDVSYGYMVVQSYHGCLKGLMKNGTFTDDFTLWKSDGDLILTTTETILDY